MIAFHEVRIDGRFRYLWLKYVTGTNLGVHCASCLKGEYSRYFNTTLHREKVICLNEHPANIVYLCGVANPYSWDNNFHLALELSMGESFDVDEHGISMTVENARRLPITTGAMESVRHPKISNRRFSTCRNWQFANYLHLTGFGQPRQ